MMMVVTVLYPIAGGATFDEGYYTASHIPLVHRLWSPLGLTDIKLLSGRPGPDGAAATYSMIALLSFESMDAFKGAAARHGAEIFQDIPKFTDAKPVLQFNEAL